MLNQLGQFIEKKKSGGFGDLGAFSTHPLKNLNACGDGGFIVTNNKKIADFIKLKRNHGHIDRDNIKFFGTVSRLDAIQAAILNFRLKKLEKVISKRVENAQYYKKLLRNEDIYHPSERSDCRDTYHLFVIQVKNRDDLKKFLLKRKIETNIHYPIPIHKQRAFNKKINLPNTEEQSKRILSLPINQYISKNEIKRVCNHIIQFVKEN